MCVRVCVYLCWGGGRGGGGVCVCSREFGLTAFWFFGFFVMGYVLQFREIAHKRVHHDCGCRFSFLVVNSSFQFVRLYSLDKTRSLVYHLCQKTLNKKRKKREQY